MLSRADSSGYSWRRSGTRVRPFLAAQRTSPLGADLPKTCTLPRRRTMPVTPIRMLDLPLPFGPVMAQASPSATVNVASCTATTFPYETDRPVTLSAAFSLLIRPAPRSQDRALGQRADQALVDRQPAHLVRARP